MAANNCEEFFNEDTPHGRKKRSIYKVYIKLFIQKALDCDDKIVIVDGFSGKGYYGNKASFDQKIQLCGSPIIILRHCIDELHRRQSMPAPDNSIKPQINLVFNEADRTNCRDLRRTTMDWLKWYRSQKPKVESENTAFGYTWTVSMEEPDFVSIQYGIYQIDIHILEGKFEDLQMPPSIPSDAKWFSIIDAFGSKAIPLACVERFLGPGKQAIVTVMSSYMNRYTDRHKTALARMFGIPEEQVDSLKSPCYGRDWETQDTKGSTRHITAHYIAVLKKRINTQYALRFEIRNVENRVLFHLVFITHDRDELRRMKRSMWFNSQSSNDFALVFSDERHSKRKWGVGRDEPDPTDKIYTNFEESRVTVSEVELFVLNNPYLAILTPSHLQTMINDGRISHVYDSSHKKLELPSDITAMHIRDIREWITSFKYFGSEEQGRVMQETTDTIYKNYNGSRTSIAHIAEFVMNNPRIDILSTSHLQTLINDGRIVRLCDSELQPVANGIQSTYVSGQADQISPTRKRPKRESFMFPTDNIEDIREWIVTFKNSGGEVEDKGDTVNELTRRFRRLKSNDESLGVCGFSREGVSDTLNNVELSVPNTSFQQLKSNNVRKCGFSGSDAVNDVVFPVPNIFGGTSGAHASDPMVVTDSDSE